MISVTHLAKYFSPVTGGIESVVLDLARDPGLNQVRVIALSSEQSVKEVFTSNITLYRCRELFKMRGMGISLVYLWRVLQTSSEHLVHIHAPNPLAMLGVALLFVLKRQNKIIVHWHSDVVTQKFIYKFLKPLDIFVLRVASAIIATSSSYVSGSSLLTEFAHKTHVVPIGVEVDNDVNGSTNLDELKRYFIGESMLLVFALGRHVPYKGFDLLIHAVSSLPHVSLVLGGDGPLTDGLIKLSDRLGCASRVHFTGRLTDLQVSQFFEIADVFCLPSNSKAEAFGVVQVEAMAHCTPIVSCAIPGSGVAEVNKHGQSGLVVEPGDASALANAIETLQLRPEFRAQLAEGAYVRYRDNFTLDAFRLNVANLYRAI